MRHVTRYAIRIALGLASAISVSSGAYALCGDNPLDQAAIATVRAMIGGQCDCEGARSHGQYVACARGVLSAAIANGVLPAVCATTVQKCTAQSTCGRRGDYVPCCKTTATGETNCRITKASRCKTTAASTCQQQATSCCDACASCAAAAQLAPTPTPTPVVAPAPLCRVGVRLPVAIALPFVTSAGTSNCGAAALSPGPAPPLSGGVLDGTGPALGLGNRIADLGLGCLYVGSLPAVSLPGGSTSILAINGVFSDLDLDLGVTSGLVQNAAPGAPGDISGIFGSIPGIVGSVPGVVGSVPGITGDITDLIGKLKLDSVGLTLGPTRGSGPTDCTFGAGPGRHCSNGAPGTDGNGTCASDTECYNKTNACNLDANCYFGPPVPVRNGVASVCSVSVIETDICGIMTLPSTTILSTKLSSRLYLGPEKSPCPLCVDGFCSAGARAGQPCSGGPSPQASIDCLPKGTAFIDTLTVDLPALVSGGSLLIGSDGAFCPGQSDPGAFGLDAARSIVEVGAGASPSVTLAQVGPLLNLNLPLPSLPVQPTLTISQTLVSTFCVQKTGGPLDTLASLPQAGALSVRGNIYLPKALVLGPFVP